VVKHGKIAIKFFRVRMLISNIMEIKRQFSLDTNSKLMDQVLQVLVGRRDKFYP